ncbi:MAG TPA: Fic family protein, partial [Candidatus Cybelea sp.]
SGKPIRLALSRADGELARLDGAAGNIVNPENLFLNALRREALLSSKIEGTRTTLADLALFDLVREPRNDSLAVADYLEAYKYGRQRCHEIPVGVALLSEIHGILTQHDDRKRTQPGRLRERTVVIGSPPPLQARFVPPPWNFVRKLVENLADYLANENEAPLIKLAIAHYQFETIHPFLDGNGRVGRILISTWLEREGILTAPMLYISAYFQQRQQEYYDRLLKVSTHGEWSEWILFFLEAVATQARDSVIRSKNLDDLRKRYHKEVEDANGRSHNTHKLVDDLFRIPVTSVPSAAELTGITYAAAKAHVQKLIRLEILDGENPLVYRGTQYYFARELIRAVEGPLPDAERTT